MFACVCMCVCCAFSVCKCSVHCCGFCQCLRSWWCACFTVTEDVCGWMGNCVGLVLVSVNVLGMLGRNAIIFSGYCMVWSDRTLICSGWVPALLAVVGIYGMHVSLWVCMCVHMHAPTCVHACACVHVHSLGKYGCSDHLCLVWVVQDIYP